MPYDANDYIRNYDEFVKIAVKEEIIKMVDDELEDVKKEVRQYQDNKVVSKLATKEEDVLEVIKDFDDDLNPSHLPKQLCLHKSLDQCICLQ